MGQAFQCIRAAVPGEPQRVTFRNGLDNQCIRAAVPSEPQRVMTHHQVERSQSLDLARLSLLLLTHRSVVLSAQ